VERVVTKLPKVSKEHRFNQQHLESGAKSSTIKNMPSSIQIPRTCPFTLGDRMNFLPLTECSSTENLGQVKAFQQTEAEKCD
jgi:hypothetical protein